MTTFVASKNITLNNLRLSKDEYEAYKMVCRSIYNIMSCISLPEAEQIILVRQVISAMKEKIDVCSLLSPFPAKPPPVGLGGARHKVRPSVAQIGLDVICKELCSYGEYVILNEDDDDTDDEYTCGLKSCDFCDIKCNGRCSNMKCEFTGVLVLHEYAGYFGPAYTFVCLDCHMSEATTCMDCGLWICEC